MDEWIVKLTGETTDKQFLVDIFKTGGVRVEKREDGYYLVARDFADLTEASLVKKRAENIVEVLNGLAKVKEENQRPVRVGNIFKLTEGRRRSAYIFPESIELRARVFPPTVTLVDGKEEPDVGDPGSQALVKQAEQDSVLAQVLKLIGGEHTWVSLYKVYELIREDAGGNIDAVDAKGWAKKADLRSFHDTANWHETPHGRHAKQTTKPKVENGL